MLKAVIEMNEDITEKEMNALADTQMKKISEAAKMYREMYHVVSKGIDEWLENRPQDYLKALFQLADSPELKKLSGKNDTIYIFGKLCEVSRKEQKEHLEPVISKFHSLGEMERIYHLTVFYLRRIELNLPGELGEDFYELMDRWKFSPYYIIAILLEKKAVYSLYSLGNDVAKELKKRGYEKDAEIILSTLHNHAEFRNAEEKNK